MPRAQGPPTTSRVHPRVSPLIVKPPSNRQETPPDVLEFASSDSPDSHSPSPHKSLKQSSGTTTQRKRKPKPKKQPSEVIEISSDDDDRVPPSQESTLYNLQAQVRRLKEENERHHKNCSLLVHELARSRLELKEAKARESKDQTTDGRLVLNLSQLEDSLSCEICTGRMYTPYMLPDCGHTFCLSCLRDWFGTTRARFVQAHPHWNINVINAYTARVQALLRPEYLHHPNIYNHLQQLQPSQPEYVCPKCRKRIIKRPVNNYALKSLVRSISAADEAEKKKIPHDKPFVEHRQGKLVVIDPWEIYFPKEPL